MKKAFTLLELLVVFALMGILLGLVIVYTQVTQVRTDLYTQVDAFAAYVRLAQSDSAAGKDGSSHGIYLGSNEYTLFLGDSYDPLDARNTVIDLPPTVEIQNISLNGGGSTLIFTAPSGGTTNYGTFDFVSSSLGQTISLTLDSSGTLDY